MLLAWLAAPPAAQAQDPTARGGAGAASGMATRSVSRYLDLERALEQAIEKRDRAAIDGLLDPDFDARSPAEPDPAPRVAWLEAALAGPPCRARVRELSLREFGDLAIVSFLLDRRAPCMRRRAGGTLFVTDVWQQSSGRLLARSVAQPVNPPALPDRPSGRE